MWNVFEISDHRTVDGRFVYPGANKSGMRYVCAAEEYTLKVSTAAGSTLDWQKDGSPFTPTTADSLYIETPSVDDEGEYTATFSYTLTLGTNPDTLNALYYPNGPVNYLSNVELPLVTIRYNDTCGVAVREAMLSELVSIYPNPTSNLLTVESQVQNNLSYQLLDLNGKLHLRGMLTETSTTLLLGELAVGLYLLRLQGNDGVAVKRVLVSK